MNNLKKLTLLGVASLGLAACGSESNAEDVKEKFSASSSISSESSVVAESSLSEEVAMEVKDGPLTEVGQYKNDGNRGTIYLEKINNINQSFELIPGLSMNVRDIKILRVEDATDSFKDTLDIFSIQYSDPLYLLQISYDVENNTDTPYRGVMINRIVSDDGIQIDNNLNSIYEDDVEAHAKRVDLFSLFVIDGKELNSFKAYANDLNAADTGYMVDAAPFDISF
jgi:hypothetical protein